MHCSFWCSKTRCRSLSEVDSFMIPAYLSGKAMLDITSTLFNQHRVWARIMGKRRKRWRCRRIESIRICGPPHVVRLQEVDVEQLFLQEKTISASSSVKAKKGRMNDNHISECVSHFINLIEISIPLSASTPLPPLMHINVYQCRCNTISPIHPSSKLSSTRNRLIRTVTPSLCQGKESKSIGKAAVYHD